MYCSTCATPLTPGLSYCNRCGANLKERGISITSSVQAYLTAITLIAIPGLGLMLGGAIALKNGAQFDQEMIGMYMFLCFLIIAVVEIFLLRQLSRVSGSAEKLSSAPQMALPTDLRATPEPRELPARSLSDQVSSVTENTTRTLGYSHNEPRR